MKNPFSLNPVALRELRQLVRSRVVTWSFALYPAVLFGFTMLAVATAMGKRTAEDVAFGNGIGDSPFTMVSVITGVVACIGIPFYAAMKAILDTNRNGPGLEFTTALTPANIVGGRLVSTAILTASAVATSMPFFIFSYLLRGIPLENVFLMPLALFGYSVATFSLSLVIACRPIAVPLRVVLTVMLFFAMTFVVPSIVSVATFSRHSFGAAPADEPSYWTALLWFAVALAALVAFVRAFCAAQLAPRYVDADRPFRRVVFALFLLSAPVVCWNYEAWCIIWVVVGGLLTITSSLNSREMPRAAKANAPGGFLGRLVSFPFATGAVPGTLFAALAVALAGGVYSALEADSDHVMTLWADVTELLCVPVVVGAVLRRKKCEERHFRLATSLFVAYIAAVSVLSFMAEIDAIEEDLVAMLPCNFAGIADKPGAHLASYGLLLLLSACVVAGSSISAFRAYRRPGGVKAGGAGAAR
jgi:hypothetical protein